MNQEHGNLSSIFPGGFRPLDERLPEDPYDAFARVLEAAGLQVEALQADTPRLVRVKTIDDDAGEKTGWYRFWIDPIPHGVYGDWRNGISEKWSSRQESELDPQTLAGVRKAREEAARRDQEERERLQAEAAKEAARIVSQASPAPLAHPYLKAKDIPPLTALLNADGRLVIPMQDEHGAIVSLQYIASDGKKRFLLDGRMYGCFHLIGEPGPKILVVEGFSTGATLHQATRLPIAVAFNAGNLPAVARNLRKLYPASRLVFCADNDQWRAEGKKNVGLVYANEAAASVSGSVVVIPQFRKEHAESKPKDFNDLAALEGLAVVRGQVDVALHTVGLEVYPASRWADRAVPERRWLLQDWIPMRQTTALYGDGGVGKTLLAQQLLTAVATNTGFLGMEIAMGTALGVFCEDDDDELHIRQHRINEMLGVQYKQLDRLHLLSRVGQENLLMQFNGHDAGELTHFWHELSATIARIKPVVVLIDTAADTFGGNEINRSHVRQYVQGALTRLGTEHNCAIVLCAHPSVAGMQSGSGAGGSTAWSNSVRSRLYLSRDESNSRTVLTRKKSNYSAAGDEIELIWNEGCFIPHRIAEASNIPTTERAIEESFIDLLEQCDRNGLKVSPHNTGRNSYAPRIFAKIAKQRGLKWRQDQYEAAMEKLLYGRPQRLFSHGTTKRGVTLSTKPPTETETEELRATG